MELTVKVPVPVLPMVIQSLNPDSRSRLPLMSTGTTLAIGVAFLLAVPVSATVKEIPFAVIVSVAVFTPSVFGANLTLGVQVPLFERVLQLLLKMNSALLAPVILTPDKVRLPPETFVTVRLWVAVSPGLRVP